MAIGDGRGTAIRLEGEPTFDLTAPWTGEHLDRTRIRPAADDRAWVNLDHAQQGIGSTRSRRASPSGCSRSPPDPA